MKKIILQAIPILCFFLGTSISLSQTNLFPTAGDGWFNGIQTGANNYGSFGFINGANLVFTGINNNGNAGLIKLYPTTSTTSNNKALITLSQGFLDFMENNHSINEPWWHGVLFQSKYVSGNLGSVGLIGNGNNFERIYLTFGIKPHNSTLGINILPNGYVGIGTLAPSAPLEITSSIANYSGLRLTNLTASSPTSFEALPIGVDALGNVVRVGSGGSSTDGWLLNGNLGTTPAISTSGNPISSGNFLGTTDAKALVFATNNIERLRITTTGRIIFHNNSSSPTNSNNLYLGGGNDISFGANNYANTVVGMGAMPLIDGNGNRNIAIGSNSLVRNSSGDNNIGVGYNAGANITTGSNNIIIGGSANAPISNTGDNQLNIANWIFGHNGQIAIGSFTSALSTVFTNNADYQLIVKKGIKTEKVRVELSTPNLWADYVFNDDYNLMSINDLDKFIQKNKHLPNVPTAFEVGRDGIDLGEMDAKLLEKIEELTLYSIDLYKENVDLKENTKLLQQENQEQQILLEELLKRVEQLELTK